MDRRSLGLVVLALTLGCSHHGGAAGDDTRVSGSWTVEGATPTAASCDEVGIDTVRLGIYAAGEVEYIDRLEAPCIAGQLDSGTPVLAAGNYDVAWEGFRDGTRVAQGARQPLVAVRGAHAVIPVVDFVSGYDPRGTDATVSARWTIDGVAPGEAACLALGITRVRIAAFHGSRAIEIAQLTATCVAGEIDTRPLAVLAAGDVVLQLQALGSHQEVLFSGAMAMLHVPSGPTHVSLYGDVPVDFTSGVFDPHGTDASVAFSWTLDHQTASIDVCDSVGASTAHLVLYAQDDTARAHGVSVAQAPCSRGSFDSGTSAVVRAGAYLASLELRDASGIAHLRASPSETPFAVTAGARFTVPAVDFAVPTTLAVTLEWVDPSTGSTTSCATAGVTTMGYSLVERTSGVTVEQRGAVPCVDRLTFDPTDTPGFGGGSYDLTITGMGGTRTWHTASTECTDITVAADTIAWDACLVATP